MANMIEQSLLCKVLDAPDLEILHSNGVVEEMFLKSEKEVLFYMTITSKEVAEMLGKRHDNLLRAIRKYITQLGDEAPNPYVLSLVVVSVWNTLNDPTTKGLGDSARAKSYTAPQ